MIENDLISKPQNADSLWQDLSGGMSIWVALTLPVILVGAALSIDAARIYNLDADLQSAADALARAGAFELDQRSDAISRADRAIQNLVQNTQNFSENSRDITASNIRYLKTLPAYDHQPISVDMETTNPQEAKFVEVTVAPKDISFIFPKSIGSTVTKSTLDAKSVAKADQGVCGVAPVFVCNPYEGDPTTTIWEALESRSFQRRQVQLKTQDKTYGPGNFGFLDPFGGGGGASAIGNAIAVDKPNVCLSKFNGVTLRTGNIASLRNAFNVRFDLYAGSYKAKSSDPAYAPAANVVKGYSGQTCKETPDEDAMGLPRDTCFDDDSCTFMDGRQGDGDWDFVEYVRINHNAAETLSIAGTTYFFDHDAGTVLPADIPTRYEMYRWEIDTGSIPGAVSYGTSSTPEEGTPVCHTHGASTADIDRRILYAAVLNCTELEDTYGMSGRETGLPVEGFVKVFVTEPMEKGKDNTLWVEMVEPVVQGRDSVARDRVSVTR